MDHKHGSGTGGATACFPTRPSLPPKDPPPPPPLDMRHIVLSSAVDFVTIHLHILPCLRKSAPPPPPGQSPTNPPANPPREGSPAAAHEAKAGQR